MRRRATAGFSLVELLTVVGLFGCVAIGASGAFVASLRDSSAASRVALERERRWETVRRLRVDAGRARSGRLVQGPLGEDGLELSTPAGVVRWLSSGGELVRTTDHSPAVQPVPFGARFELERTGGRVFVRYRLGDGASALEGRALLGAAP